MKFLVLVACLSISTALPQYPSTYLLRYPGYTTSVDPFTDSYSLGNVGASFAGIPQNGLNTKYTNVAGDKEYWNGKFASLKTLIQSEDNEALGAGKEYWNGIFDSLKPLIQSQGN